MRKTRDWQTLGLLIPVMSLSLVMTVRGAEGAAKRRITLAPLGDSRTAAISYDDAGLQRSTVSFHNWANALHERKYPCTGNFGLSGATSDKIVAGRLIPALDTHPTFLTILMGVNDVKTPGFNAGRTMANITAAANKALAQGVIPILITDPGSTHYNSAQVVFINEVNERIKAYCMATPKAVLFDLATLLSVRRSPAIEFHPGWSNDGVHLSVLGAYHVGAAFADLLDSLGADTPEDPGVAGNLIANSRLEGNGGTAGKGNAGVLPDNFVGGRDNEGCCAVFSVKTRGIGGREIIAQLTTTNPAGFGGFRLTQTLPVSVLGAGEALEAGVKVDLDAGSVKLAEIRVELDLVFKDGFVSTYDFCGTKSAGVLSGNEGGPSLSLTLQTAGVSCPAGRELKSIQFKLGAKTLGAGSATLRFREPWCRKRPAVIHAEVKGPDLPPDDDSIICNHYRPAGFAVDKIRCKNARVPGGMLLFVRDSATSVELPVQNDTTNSIDAAFTLEQIDRRGVVMRRQAGPLPLAGNSATAIPYTVDTRGLPYGVYSLVLNVMAGGKSLAAREYYFGVISGTVIPKSRDDDFLYGLDPNYGGILPKTPTPASPGRRARSGQCDLLGWVDASGADLLRAGGFGLGPGPLTTNLADVAVLRKNGLRVLAMAWTPEPEPGNTNGFNAKVMDKWLAQVEATARSVPDVTYWELGNEPDLGYPGIDRYVQVFESTSHAVRKGNPNAKIMNGGITFFGEKGPPNSRRLIQRVDPGTIDVIAYHAHGPGSQAERTIYEQTRAAAIEFGKADKPLADTESGMFVGTKRQEDIQSWMVVQKQVYAQSVGLKFLMTFRLHAFRHGDTGYGLLRADAEPNPAFLAYRTLTEHLKGLTYEARLSLRQPEAEGYSFVETDGSRRACVLWANRSLLYNVNLRVQKPGQPAEHLRVMDLYGNTTLMTAGPDGSVCVEVGEAPVYLLWNAAERDFRVSVTPSLLHLQKDRAEVIPKVSTPVGLTIENPTSSAMTATVSAAMSVAGEGTVEPAAQILVIPAATTRPVRLDVCWTPAGGGVVWPSTWCVFTGIEERDVDLAGYARPPEMLKGAVGRTVKSEHGKVNLLTPGELPREKKPGIAFAVVRSDREQVVKIGCCADWWLELRLNGQVVCSTMEKGNAFMTPVERIIELPLKKGDNLLAARVLGGKGGLSLTLISPLELPGLLDSGRTMSGLSLALSVGGRDVARERLALVPVICPRVLHKGGSEASQAGVDPDFVLDGESVDNFFVKLPEREKWWGGPKDLMARAWLRTDRDGLNLVVEVVDDKDITGTTMANLPESDVLRLGIARDAGQEKQFDVIDIGRVKDETLIVAGPGNRRGSQGSVLKPETGVKATVTRHGSMTRYVVSVSRALLGDGVFRLNMRVNDNDEGYRKQCLEWKPGWGERPDASSWQPVILSRLDDSE